MLFLGPQSEPEPLLANSELSPLEAGTNLDDVYDRLGEVAGVMTQLAVVVFVAEEGLEE